MQKETHAYMEGHRQVEAWSQRIRGVDRNNRYADSDEYRFMNTEELKKVRDEMKAEYVKLTKKGDVEIVEQPEPDPAE